MFAVTQRYGHYTVVQYDSFNFALVIFSSHPGQTNSGSDFDVVADALREQQFLPTAISYVFDNDEGTAGVTLWTRQGVGLLNPDDLTRELSEQVARQAEALVYRPSERLGSLA